MKLLQINVVVNYGSTGRIVDDIGQMVQNADWESYIVYGRKPRVSLSQSIQVGTRWDIGWHGFQARLLDRQGLGSKRATRQLIKQIREINPDIIHLHVLHGYYLNYPVLFEYLAEANIPVVWTLHDCWPFTGHCSYFSRIQCDKWKYGCEQCPQIRKYPKSWWRDRSAKNYEEKRYWFTSVKNMVLVPVSDWLGDLVKSSFFKSFPVYRIYNGIDMKVYSPKNTKMEVLRKYNIQAGFLILGVANVWSSRKGLNDFIRLRALLPEDVQILLVGLLEDQIKRLPAGITGIRRTESVSELAEIYSASDVYFNPSLEETFGLTTVESLSCGTPVIVYNATASPELLSENTGYVVDVHDLKAVFHAVEEIRVNGKAYYGHICREYALKFFSKEESCVRYLELYERMCSNRQSR